MPLCNITVGFSGDGSTTSTERAENAGSIGSRSINQRVSQAIIILINRLRKDHSSVIVSVKFLPATGEHPVPTATAASVDKSAYKPTDDHTSTEG